MEKKPSYNISEEELIRISEYLNGGLTSGERSALEDRMLADHEFRKKVDEVRALQIGIRETYLTEQLEAFHAKLPDTKRTVKVNNLFWRRSGWLAAAAVFVFAMISLWFFWPGQTPEQKLFSRYYKVDPGLPTLMGASDDYAFETAMVDYKMGNYQEALGKWQPLLMENPGNDTLNYFMGVAYLAVNRPDSALMLFDRTVGTPGSAFRSDAYWYKALALLKQGKSADALLALKRTEHHTKDSLLHAITLLP